MNLELTYQAQIGFGKNNPSSIFNLRVGSHRYKKILCNHLQFIKYFVTFYTLSLQSDSHFPRMVLLPDEVLWSHLALPEKLRWSHSYNLGSVISMSTKSDPKYASFEFSSLQNKGVLSKIPPFWRQLSSPSLLKGANLIVVRHETPKNTSYPLLQNHWHCRGRRERGKLELFSFPATRWPTFRRQNWWRNLKCVKFCRFMCP